MMTSDASEQPLISVIISVFNGKATIGRAFESFKKQTYLNRELIVIDGGSTDGTVDEIRKNANLCSHWESERDRGIYHAFNKGVTKSKGQWILFLGADDYFWTPDALARAVPVLQKASDRHRIVYGKVAVVDDRGMLIEEAGTPWEVARKYIRHEMSIPHQGTFHHRSLYEKFGLYREEFRIAGDYELVLRDLNGTEPLFIPDLIVAGMQIGGISSLPSSTLRAIQEFRLARRLNGITDFSFHLFKREMRARVRSGIRSCFGEQASNWMADTYRLLVGKSRMWTRK